jgi:hypothetical protein
MPSASTSAVEQSFQYREAKTPAEKVRVIKEIVRSRNTLDVRNPQARLGVGIAMEVVVRLMAPELFDEVLQAVQEYASGRR